MISTFENRVFLKFLVVGVLNTLFSVGVYWLLLYMGLIYQWAVALSMVLGIIFSYNNHRSLVFKASGVFVRYVMVWFIIYFVNIALISVIRRYIGDYFAAVVLLPVNVMLSFMLMKLFVFQENSRGAE